MKRLLLFLFILIVFIANKVASQTATVISVLDTRSENLLPEAFRYQVRFDFKARDVISVPGAGSYSGLLTFAPWGDFTGNKVHQLNFNDGGLYWRVGSQGSNWESWKALVLSDEYGKVGIGTNTNLEEKLHVNGNLFLQATEIEGAWLRTNLYYSGHNLVVGSKPGVYTHNNLMLRPGGSTQGSLGSGLQLYTSTGVNQHLLKINLTSEGASYFNGGNVGIGTNNPQNLLDVNGIIHAREVKVDLTGWSDFVFHPSYKLKPLSEVELFIKTNGHLQDIPSAAEVEQNGVNMGEMQAKLLQKVEELTLYVIELKKENEQKEKIMNEQQKRLINLENELNQLKKEN